MLCTVLRLASFTFCFSTLAMPPSSHLGTWAMAKGSFLSLPSPIPAAGPEELIS